MKQQNETKSNAKQFNVIRTPALDSFGNAIFSELGKQIFNYEVFGILMGKEVKVQLDVVTKSYNGNTESKAAAFELLDLVFANSDQPDNIVIRPVKKSFTGRDGKEQTVTSYALYAIEPDTGFEMELPIKPRSTTDNTKLENLMRKQEWLASLAKNAVSGGVE